jgi:hypothetical protein
MPRTPRAAQEAATSKPPPLSCRLGLTTILGPTPKLQQAVRLSVKSTDASGEPQHVLKVRAAARDGSKWGHSG